MNTIAATPKSTLPQYKGRPVPWITRWTGEVVNTSLQVEMGDPIRLRYEDRKENRDALGVLWKREGLTRSGEPQWSQINTYRQRAAMNRKKCQVCGSGIDERPIRWLMPREGLNMEADETAITISAPTCEACIPLALELCPYLRNNPWAILKVLEYQPWGVYGEAVHMDEETGKGRDLRGIWLPYKDSPIPLSAVVAFQQIVQLTKFVIEEES